MIENVSTQLTVFHCFAHCLLPGRAFASLYALLFLEKEAEIGGRDNACVIHTNKIVANRLIGITLRMRDTYKQHSVLPYYYIMGNIHDGLLFW